jgi:hypothetical protein
VGDGGSGRGPAGDDGLGILGGHDGRRPRRAAAPTGRLAAAAAHGTGEPPDPLTPLPSRRPSAAREEITRSAAAVQ